MISMTRPCFLRGVSTSIRYVTPALSSMKTSMYRTVMSPPSSRDVGMISLRRCFMSSSQLYDDFPAHNAIAMPALSPTMVQGNIASWAKAEGDAIAAGDVLAEIETDKAIMEFEAVEDGYLARILVDAGTKDIPVGQTLCVIVEDEGDVKKFADYVGKSATESSSAASTPPAEAPPATPPATPAVISTDSAPTILSPPSGPSRIFASPLARKMAIEQRKDLSTIVGSGPGSRIVKSDVMNASANAAPIVSSRATNADTVLNVAGNYTDIPLSNVRGIIAQRLVQSKQTVPHYYLSVDVRMDAVAALRAELNASAGEGEYKISFNDFIIKASALALRRVPEANSQWGGTFIREFHSVDISVAVDTGDGLITPIIFDADRRGLSDISSTVKELAGRAKVGRLQPQEFQGGTFTISNLGMYGVRNFSAIINPPQACILAVGAVEKRVVPDDAAENGMAVATMMGVTLSSDHRVVDGAVGATWLKHFKGFLENPITMLL